MGTGKIINMQSHVIPGSELIINSDGTIYHLHLHPEHLADTIITVGDQERVSEISKHFDRIEHRVQNREFLTHTGRLGAKRITVVSTGIGTDNIDIVFNELDALANIDFQTRTVKNDIRQLTIIRLGTSGAVNEDIPLDSIVLSEAGIGTDSLMAFYHQTNSGAEQQLADAFQRHIAHSFPAIRPYATFADEKLLEQFRSIGQSGITVTAPGFYAPQGRRLRSDNLSNDLIPLLHSFHHQGHRITNLEMETAGIYTLGRHLGHRCLSVSAILAHRIFNTFSVNPKGVIDRMITDALQILADGD
jgi:uridine phosphorylase